MIWSQILNFTYAITNLALGLWCLYIAEVVDNARTRSGQGPAEKLPPTAAFGAIAFYVVSSFITAGLAPSWKSPSLLLKYGGTAFVTAIVGFGIVYALSVKARAGSFASRSVAAFTRATGIFLLNLGILYAVTVFDLTSWKLL